MQYGRTPRSILFISITLPVCALTFRCTRTTIRIFWRPVIRAVRILAFQSPLATGETWFTRDVDMAPDLARTTAGACRDSVRSVWSALDGTPSGAGHSSREMLDLYTDRVCSCERKAERAKAADWRVCPMDMSADGPRKLAQGLQTVLTSSMALLSRNAIRDARLSGT